MKFISKSESTITKVMYIIEIGKNTYYYTEWQNEGGKVIDSEIRDEDGGMSYDWELLESIQEYLDHIGQ